MGLTVAEQAGLGRNSFQESHTMPYFQQKFTFSTQSWIQQHPGQDPWERTYIRQYQGVHPNHNDGIQFSRDAKAAAVAELLQETGQGGQFAGLTQNDQPNRQPLPEWAG